MKEETRDWTAPAQRRTSPKIMSCALAGWSAVHVLDTARAQLVLGTSSDTFVT